MYNVNRDGSSQRKDQSVLQIIKRTENIVQAYNTILQPAAVSSTPSPFLSLSLYLSSLLPQG